MCKDLQHTDTHFAEGFDQVKCNIPGPDHDHIFNAFFQLKILNDNLQIYAINLNKSVFMLLGVFTINQRNGRVFH